MSIITPPFLVISPFTELKPGANQSQKTCAELFDDSDTKIVNETCRSGLLCPSPAKVSVHGLHQARRDGLAQRNSHQEGKIPGMTQALCRQDASQTECNAPAAGRATDHMLRFLAPHFGVTAADIELVFGRMNVNKQLRIKAPTKLPAVFT